MCLASIIRQKKSLFSLSNSFFLGSIFHEDFFSPIVSCVSLPVGYTESEMSTISVIQPIVKYLFLQNVKMTQKNYITQLGES